VLGPWIVHMFEADTPLMTTFVKKLHEKKKEDGSYYHNIWVLHYTEDVPTRAYANWSCKSINAVELAEKAKPVDDEQRTNCLSPYFKETISVLLENFQRTDYNAADVNLQAASYSAMTTMVQNACSDSTDIIFDLLVPALQSLEQTTQQPKNDASMQFQEQLCCLLQVCLYSTGHKIDLQYQTKINAQPRAILPKTLAILQRSHS
jgi:hypothetical protein